MDYPVITVFEDENAKLGMEFAHGLNLLHFQVYNWNLSIYKDLLSKWEVILESLKESGLSEIHSCVPKDDPQVMKFQNMFGLEAFMENEDFTIYRLEL